MSTALRALRVAEAATIGDNWRTPRVVLDRVDAFCQWVGDDGIALDPCSGPGSLVSARVEMSLERGHDGLMNPWAMLVDCGVAFVNPPYSKPAPWIAAAQAFGAQPLRHAVVLVNAMTSDGWWPDPWPPAVCFWRGRIRFGMPTGEAAYASTRPSALLYFGASPELFEAAFKGCGKVVRS